MLVKKAMSLRGATWAKALGVTRQSRNYTGRACIGYEIAALRNDIFFYFKIEIISSSEHL
jgi:hypothetical protein